MTTKVLSANDVDSAASKRFKDVVRSALRTPEFAAFACVAGLVGAVHALNLVAGLRFATSDAELLPRLALLAPIYALCRVRKATAMVAEIILFGALFFVMSLSLTKLTYLAFSLRFPLQDAAFHRADAAMGFDWDAWQAFLHAHPMLLDTLDWCYKSHSWQLALSIGVLAFVKPRLGNTFLIFTLSLAGVLTATVSAFVPAIGPGAVLGWPVSFLPVIHAIREGANVALPNAGIVQFPSYHTVMAIVFTYVCRDVKLLLAPAAALNTLVVLSVPFSGNHYAFDIVGGAIVAAVSIWAAGLLCKRFGGKTVRA